jgi:plastocyanin
VLPPGSCVGDGKTTFGAFFAEVTATQKAAAWKFDPSMLTLRNGRPVILENEGGETHSFTMVKAFGGGVVPILNQLSVPDLPLAPECASLDADGNIVGTPPSATNVYVAADKEAAFKTAGLTPGKYMFQCCIHPWMRVILTVT